MSHPLSMIETPVRNGMPIRMQGGRTLIKMLVPTRRQRAVIHGRPPVAMICSALFPSISRGHAFEVTVR